jgi:parvulin-like peptidyl-prolyl isomerase
VSIPVWLRYSLCGLLGAGLGAGAMSARMTGGDSALSDTPLMATAPAKALELPQLERLIGVADATERSRILESAESFKAFVEQEAQNQSVLISAYAQAADREPAAQTLMGRAAQRVLVESYLGQILRSKMVASTPTAEKARAFYTEHPEQFQIPERVHLWQIFLPATSDTERQNAQALGRQLMEALVGGKESMAELAQRHSGHPPSGLNGGYMGLLSLAELKPEIRVAIEGVPAGKFVGPVESAEGYHLLQRGTSVAGSTLEFAAAEPQVMEYLRRQVADDARRQAVQQMVATYPVTFASEKLAEWRTKLMQMNVTGAPAKAAK